MLSALIKSMGLGAGLMYFYDPKNGRRRRAGLRDQFNSMVNHSTNRVYRFVDVGRRDLRNRAQGLLHERQARMTEEHVSDDVLLERVRATMGHYVSNAHALDVSVDDGCVAISGPVAAHEAPRLLHAISQVRGVCDVENQMDVRDLGIGRAGQFGGSCHWSPGMRLVATGIGSLLMLNCVSSRTPSAVLLGTVGFGLFLRGATDRPLAEVSQQILPATCDSAEHSNGAHRRTSPAT